MQVPIQAAGGILLECVDLWHHNVAATQAESTAEGASLEGRAQEIDDLSREAAEAEQRAAGLEAAGSLQASSLVSSHSNCNFAAFCLFDSGLRLTKGWHRAGLQPVSCFSSICRV